MSQITVVDNFQALRWRKRLFFVLLPLLIVIAALTTQVKTDISAFVVAGDNAEEILLASEMQSGSLSRRYILSIGSGSKEPVSKSFTDDFIVQLQNIDGIADVWQPGHNRISINAVQDLYQRYGSSLYSRTPETELRQIFSDHGLRNRATLLKQALLSPQAATVKKIAVNDPLLLSLNGFQSLTQNLQEDPQFRTLFIETDAGGLDVVQQKRIQSTIEQRFSRLNKTRKDGNHLEMTGVPVYATATQTLLQGDIGKVSLLSSIALTALFLWMFRSVGAMFWVFSILAAVVACSVLVTQLIFGYIHGMTLAIGTTLVGICLDYPIHGLVHARSASAQQRIPSIVRIWPSMLLGGATTMIGYSALGACGYPGFQQVAVYAVTGIITSLLLTRYLLPSLIKTAQTRSLAIPLLGCWTMFCNRFRGALLLILALCLIGSIASLTSLQWIDDLQDLTPELDYLKSKDREIRSRIVSIEPGRFVLVTGKDTESALRKTEQVYTLLNRLKSEGALSDYFGLYPWLLSAQQQQKNQRLLHQYLTEDRIQAWKQALQKQGLSVPGLGSLKYPLIDPLTVQQVLRTPVKRLIDTQLLVSDSQTLIMIWIGQHNPELLRSEMQAIDGAQYFSQRDLLNKTTAEYRDQAQTMLYGGIVLILLLLMARYRNILVTLRTLLPAVMAAFFILAGWSLAAVAISFLHLVGFLLAVAICVDYGIFYGENRGGNIAVTYQAMAASMLTSASAFGCLIIAKTSALAILAGVVALGVILGFLLCPIIIKPASVIEV